MSSAGGRTSPGRVMASVRTSVVPPGPRPPPADTPGTPSSITTPQVTGPLHDSAASLRLPPTSVAPAQASPGERTSQADSAILTSTIARLSPNSLLTPWLTARSVCSWYSKVSIGKDWGYLVPSYGVLFFSVATRGDFVLRGIQAVFDNDMQSI
jgi:hypothetical protein